MAKNPHLEQQRSHKRVFLDNADQESQALRILVSCFAKMSHFEEYLYVKGYNTLWCTVSHTYSNNPGVYTKADTATTQPPEDPAQRPLLSIYSSYKISNANITKAPVKSTLLNEEKDGVADLIYAAEGRHEHVMHLFYASDAAWDRIPVLRPIASEYVVD